MKSKIRILMVEDNLDDALLIVNEFLKTGYDPEYRRVWTPASLENALREGCWDLITCDNSMPAFDAKQALAIAAKSGSDLPFIIVSGAIGELEAIEIMKAGAHDYLLKDLNLARLPAAADREIREAKSRAARRRAEVNQALLSELSSVLGSSLDLSSTLGTTARILSTQFADACLIELPGSLESDSDKGQSFFYLQSHPIGTEQLAGAKRSPILSEMLSFPVSKLIHELDPAHPLARAFGLKSECRSLISTPIRVRENRLGTLVLLASGTSKRFDEQDREFASSLAHRCALAIDNARLYQKAQDSIRLRDDFLLLASHELRTPLTPLKLRVQTLLRSFQDDKKRLSEKTLVEILTSMDQQISRFLVWIENLLGAAQD